MGPSRRKWLIVFSAIAIGAGAYLWRKEIRVPWITFHEIQFADLPANDDGLTKWLQSYPGVDAKTVQVVRGSGNPEVLHISFTQWRSLIGEPARPAVEHTAKSIEYSDR
jgi:hypothetical protein